MSTLRLTSALLVSVTALASCTSKAPGTAGPEVRIEVSALTLEGVAVACYDLAVTTSTGTVWSRGDASRTALGAAQNGGTAGAPDAGAVCSDRYGSGGDITFIGTCDASLGADTVAGGVVQNEVTLWIDGLYDGSPSSSGTADLGDWRNPCPSSGCKLQIDCLENRDSLASFDLTLMRAATQGFFDVAVSFGDIFCSAKLDSCYPDRDGDEQDDPILLLFGDDQDRDWTAVLGFACSAGPDGAGTALAYGPIHVSCGAETFAIDPSGGPGNAEATSTPGGLTLHYAVYRGAEALQCGAGSCHKLYWNLAFDLADLVALGACELSAIATAHDSAETWTGGLPDTGGAAIPYVSVDAQLTQQSGPFCQRRALDDASAVVSSVYRGGLGGLSQPVAMCHELVGAVVTPTTADCDATPPTGGDSPWATWQGTFTATTSHPFEGNEHDSLVVGPDRILWTSDRLGWEGRGGLRLFAIDRGTDSVAVVAETSLTALLGTDPDWQDLNLNWYHDENLFRRADGSIDLFFYGDRNASAGNQEGLMIFRLSIANDTIALAGPPRFIPIADFAATALTGVGSEVTLSRSFATALSSGRYLYSYEVQAEGTYQSGNLSFWGQAPAELTLHGAAAINGSSQLALSNPAGGERGVAVWPIELNASQPLRLNVDKDPAFPPPHIVFDRQPGPTVVDPIALAPSAVRSYGIIYDLIPPESGSVYLKLFAPEEAGSEAVVNSVSWEWGQGDHLLARMVDLSDTNGTLTLGAATRVPAPSGLGIWNDINSHRLEPLPGGRVLLHVGNDSVDDGITNIVSRILDTTTTPFTLHPWAQTVSTAFGPDWPFPSSLNTDTLTEGLIGSVNYDVGEDEPFVASFGIGATAVTPIDSFLLTPPLASAEYRNGVRYLGDNTWLYAVRMDGVYVPDPDTGADTYPGREHRYYLITTDGLGGILDVSDPFVTAGGARSPLIERLDDDHLFVAWRYYDNALGQQVLQTQLLIRP